VEERLDGWEVMLVGLAAYRGRDSNGFDIRNPIVPNLSDLRAGIASVMVRTFQCSSLLALSAEPIPCLAVGTTPGPEIRMRFSSLFCIASEHGRHV
jgi:hypothetical protein